MTALYILASTVRIFLGVVYFALFVRAILSWFIMDNGNVIMTVLGVLTEPFVAPIRFLLSHFRFVQESPLDISYLVAFLVLIVLQNVLPVPAMP